MFKSPEERKLFALMMGAGLLGNRGTLGQGVGQGLLSGYGAVQDQRQRTDRSAQEAQEREVRQMQIGQMQRQQRDQGAIGRIYSSNTMPGNLAPNDDEGNVMPVAPQGMNLQGLQSGLMSAGPAGLREAAAIQGLLQKQQPKYHNVGGNLVPEPTMPGQKVEPVYQAPREQWVDAGKDPRTGQSLQKNSLTGQLRAVGGVGPTVNVNNRQESEFNKKMGANYAEEYTGILKAGAASGGEMQELQRFENIIAKVPTGKLEPLKAEVSKLGASLGFDVDTKKLGFQESLEALSNKFALTLRNPAGGAGMPGALSDKDREFLVSMVPGLAKTPAGNRIIVEAFKRAAQRKSEAAQLARDYVKRNGTFDAGYYQELEKLAAKDIMSDLREQAEQLGGAANENDPLGIRAR